MQPQAPVFGEIYQDYLAQLGRAWPNLPCVELGATREGEAILADFFGRPHRVTPQGIAGPDGHKPSHMRCVVLAKYLLAQPDGVGPNGRWVSYRNFKDASPYAPSFAQYAEGRIARDFAGRQAELARGLGDYGARPADLGLSYDLCLLLPALPRTPLLLLFNDQGEMFPASCSLLFDQNAPVYLDMECLAILGLILAEELAQAHPAP